MNFHPEYKKVCRRMYMQQLIHLHSKTNKNEGSRHTQKMEKRIPTISHRTLTCESICFGQYFNLKLVNCSIEL